jgi:Glycosyltransferases, probably involved in cell wall biogenesis
MQKTDNELYPLEKEDRRLKPHSPSRSPSRRGENRRYIGATAVDLHDPKEERPPLACTSVNISRTGLLLALPKNEQAPHVGQVFTARFSLPHALMPESYESDVRLKARVVRLEAEGEQPRAALCFEEPLTSYLQARRWRRYGILAVGLVTLATMAALRLRQESIFYFLFNETVFLYSLVASAFLITRYIFALSYKPVPVDPDYTPGVSIIIPCFNEERWISHTILRAIDQNYPEDKLEVILVDDGSTDGSYQRAVDIAERLRKEKDDDRFSIIRFSKNVGKRHVLASGVRRAKHDLLVFVDSDSFLSPTAVREVVQPFKDPKMGAVAGRTDVYNKWTNWLTKVQEVRYFVAFRIFKAAEGVFDAVTCLSGPLACYRKSLVLENLEAWCNQTFLGQPATYGDDRSMTNFILAKHRTGYQDSAVCHTIVPSKMNIFIRQQMRWKRSWLRENLRAASFMWRKESFMAVSFYTGLVLPILAPFIVLRAFVYLPVLYGIYPFVFLVGIFVMSSLMSSSYLLFKRSYLWVYGYIFCALYLVVLMWQMPWSILTFWKSSWGTRSTSLDIQGKGTAYSEAMEGGRP